MNSRQRVLATLSHQTPDRVPLDLSGHRSSGVSAIAYARLRRHLGLPKRPIRVYDPVQQLAIVDDDVLERFRIDTIELGRAFAQEDEYWRDWELPDGTPCQMPVWAFPDREDGAWLWRSPRGNVLGHMLPGTLYFEQVHFPFLEADDLSRLPEALDECMWSAIRTPPGPLAQGAEGEKTLAEGARRLRAQTDRAIIGLFGGNLLETGQCLYRHDRFFLLLAGEPDRAHQFLDALLALHLANLEKFLRAVGPHIDVILFGDDLGMQTGPQMSVAMYREFFQPRQMVMWRRVKELANVRIMLHCCGGVFELLPGLIEAGLEAINPVQITCRGMDPAKLKQHFGKQMTFWGGGCDTREVLARGTPQQVRENVARLLEVWKPGGGYIFQQVHNILADVPPENVVAMYDAAYEFGGG